MDIGTASSEDAPVSAGGQAVGWAGGGQRANAKRSLPSFYYNRLYYNYTRISCICLLFAVN
jgi:hypothetical protein